MDEFKKKVMYLGSNTGSSMNFGYEGTEQDLRENYDLKKLYLLKGKNGNGKNTLMNTVANHFGNNDKDIYLCSGDSISTDAVIIHSDKGNWGLVDATAPHDIAPQKNNIDQVVDLAQFIDPTKVKVSDVELAELAQKRLAFYEQSNKYLAQAQLALANLKDVDPRQIQALFQPIYDMLREYGIEPTDKNIEAFTRSVTSEGVKDLSGEWTDTIHYIDANEQTASQLFRQLGNHFGGYSFKHYLKPNEMLEGFAIGGHMFKVSPDMETQPNQDILDKAVESLQGADRDTHNILENVYKHAVDFKGVTEVTNNIIEDMESDSEY